MTTNFFDTSALGKHYHVELGTPRVDQLLQAADSKTYISRLTTVELLSVFAGKVRTGVISAADFHLLRRQFLSDVAKRRFGLLRMTNAWLQNAERLISQHGMTHHIRTLDALQPAAALALKERNTDVQFVCADRRLLTIAALEGLIVINPETT